jgi:pimeloyl-ACP methyl ester carboxylesterase
LPVVCLPGLSRTAGDFDVLAGAIAADAATPRRVPGPSRPCGDNSRRSPGHRSWSFTGANSDILGSETVAAMKTRCPGMDVLVVPDQGHAPPLAEADIIVRIKQFAEKCDAAHAEAAV